VGCATNLPISLTGKIKMEMMDVGKWNSHASESVRHQLEKAAAKGLPAVGFCIVYMDHKGDHILWNYETHLAFDPNNPPSEEERAKLERIFAGYAHLAQKVMNQEEEPH
jgi:hypothetical protein